MDVDGYPLYERTNNIGKGYEKVITLSTIGVILYFTIHI
jgi:hypothetical protein